MSAGEENRMDEKKGNNLPTGKSTVNKKPRNPVADAIIMLSMGVGMIIIDIIALYGFNLVLRFKRTVPVYFVGILMTIAGLVMLIVALIKKSKNKTSINNSNNDSRSPEL
jgi:uncharacterized membrane protein HdeD (DUF308 family)